MKNTTHVQLLHNPKAGDQNHVKPELIKIIESLGFTYRYSSIKEKGWKHFDSETELVVMAGGDGTVKETIKLILNRTILDKPLTLALLPTGTANNFAKALGISAEPEVFKHLLTDWNPKKIDVGAINNIPKVQFFIEGLGCGLIPELITEMQSVDSDKIDTVEKELDAALEKLTNIVDTYPAKRAKVIVDGNRYEGDYLMVEVLNIRSIGPNLVLAPAADPTDGKFEVALLKESSRKEFSAYLRRLRQKAPLGHLTVPWQIVTATHEVIIDCDNRAIHIDDEVVMRDKKKKIGITVRHGAVDVIA